MKKSAPKVGTHTSRMTAVLRLKEFRANGRSVAASAQAALDASRAGTVARLPRSTKLNGRFVIDPQLFPDYVDHITTDGFAKLMRWRKAMKNQSAPVPSLAELEQDLPVRRLDFKALAAPPASGVQVTWLGHASVLVQWDGWSILADPIFSERCAPYQCVGPKRLRPSPAQAADLPPVDAIVISHSHYDHLDTNSVRDLAAHHQSAVFYVPLGMKSWYAR